MTQRPRTARTASQTRRAAAVVGLVLVLGWSAAAQAPLNDILLDPTRPLVFQLVLPPAVIEALREAGIKLPLPVVVALPPVAVPNAPGVAVPGPVGLTVPGAGGTGVPPVVLASAPAAAGVQPVTLPGGSAVGTSLAAVTPNAPKVTDTPAAAPVSHSSAASGAGVAPVVTATPGPAGTGVTPVTTTSGQAPPGATQPVTVPVEPAVAGGPVGVTTTVSRRSDTPQAAVVSRPAAPGGAGTGLSPVTTASGPATAGVPGGVAVTAPTLSPVLPTAVNLGAAPAPRAAFQGSGQLAAIGARLFAGDRSDEVLAMVRALSTDEVKALLAKAPRQTPADQSAADVLVAELLQRPGVPQDGPGDLPTAVALHVAESFARHDDKRCISWCEGLLGRRQAKETTEIPEIGALAGYYGRTRQHRLAAETWLRHEKYSAWANANANSLVEAARAYEFAGDHSKAEAAYALVEALGYGWASGLSLIDRACWLRAHGQLQDAQRLLERPVTGLYSEQIELVRLFYLGEIHLDSGDALTARLQYQHCLDAKGKLAGVLVGEGLESILAMNEQRVALIDQFAVRPIQLSVGRYVIGHGERPPLKVLSLKAGPVVISCSPTGIACDFVGDWRREGRLVVRELAIRCVAEGLPRQGPVGYVEVRAAEGGLASQVLVVRSPDR